MAQRKSGILSVRTIMNLNLKLLKIVYRRGEMPLLFVEDGVRIASTIE